MAAGNRQIIINTQERAISPDFNRMQKFQNADMAELFRYMLDVGSVDDLDAGSVITEHTALETPLRGEIFNGLLVRPQAGSLGLAIDPGVLYLLSPDGAVDDSNYKFIHDAGLVVAAGLTMTSNASGSIRIDVIECRVNPTDLTINDNRDIFNPSTGLFVAGSVVKERKGHLEYRVRLGTPGGGFPGTVQGWLPLAVASVPDATTTNNTINFWDVRPLLSDREFAPSANTRDLPYMKQCMFNLFTHGTGVGVMQGQIDVSYGGRRLGGILRTGSSTLLAEFDFFACGQTFNREPGFVAPAPGFVYLYFLVPFGLPRWARYTIGPAGRVPRSPRGIPVLSTTPPNSLRGTPSSPIALPTATGFAGSTSNGVCGASLITIAAGPGDAVDMSGDGRAITIGSGPIFYFGHLAVAGVNSLGKCRFTLTPGVDYPVNARALYVTASLSIVTGVDFEEQYYFTLSSLQPALAGYHASIPTFSTYYTKTGGTKLILGQQFRIPIPNGYPLNTLPGNLTLDLDILGNSSTPTSNGSFLNIQGWDIGP